MPTESKDTSGSPPEKQPGRTFPVQVQCEGFRCMAYKDENGHWIDYHSGKPLGGKIRAVESPE